MLPSGAKAQCFWGLMYGLKPVPFKKSFSASCLAAKVPHLRHSHGWPGQAGPSFIDVPALPSLCENLLDKVMGAPGLAFETWDPPRKCRKAKLENSNFEKGLGTDATRSNSHAH
jgi:hypothetical protein